ncbi:trypsin delta-like [Drosophila novamexicana]|uniref:trypsin delta-like n=1 Tax=Drosophila novamexicana TaxID=47314 RepID=UPI0011E5C456|nr:trypsin delta-like [Drosophila novamexicana]
MSISNLFLLLLLFSTMTVLDANRIVNGYPIDIREAPWQVSIQKNGFHFCGGSILSSKIILTAAHCLARKETRILSIRAGSKYWRNGGQVVKVAEIKIHNAYHARKHLHDIALMRLAKPIRLGYNAQAISLTSSVPREGAKAFVTGWGLLKAKSRKRPSILQEVNLRIMTYKRCQRTNYGRYGYYISRQMICASLNSNDACQGDSGGPLVSRKQLVGIVSWGKGCASRGFPGVYTNIAYYSRWLKSEIPKLEMSDNDNSTVNC